jgi:hypothetical protein
MENDEIRITGSSDDLVEVDGAESEEYGCYDSDVFLSLTDGTELLVHYNDGGIWKIKVLRKGTAYATAKRTHLDEETEETYTEEFSIRGAKVAYAIIGKLEGGTLGKDKLRFEDVKEAE